MHVNKSPKLINFISIAKKFSYFYVDKGKAWVDLLNSIKLINFLNLHSLTSVN